jgi:hypothetical protein
MVDKKIIKLLERNKAFKLSRFPLGFWNYRSLSDTCMPIDANAVDLWSDAGFTLTMTPCFDSENPEHISQILRYLDKASDKNIKMIVCDHRIMLPKIGETLPDDYHNRVSHAIKSFGDHQATFGFCIGDEPDKSRNEMFFNASRVIKQTMPDLNAFINLLPKYPGVEIDLGYSDYSQYLDSAVSDAKLDFLCYDCYSQLQDPRFHIIGRNGPNDTQDGLEMYFENLSIYRQAAIRNAVPFWTTLLSVGHFRYRCPTYDDLRWQLNTALCFGASGILWFYFYTPGSGPSANYRMPPVDECGELTETYYNLRKVQKTFSRRYGDLFLKIFPNKTMFYPHAFAGTAAFSPDDLISEIITDDQNHPLLISEFIDAQGRPYVMLVNNSQKDNAHVAIVFSGQKTKVYSYDWYGQEIEGHAYSRGEEEVTCVKNGLRIWHWLAPGQEAVYRIEKNDTIEEEASDLKS